MTNHNDEFLNNVNNYLQDHSISLTAEMAKKSIFKYLVLKTNSGAIVNEIKIKPIMKSTIVKEEEIRYRTPNSFPTSGNNCHASGSITIIKETPKNITVNPYDDTYAWLEHHKEEIIKSMPAKKSIKFF